MARQGGLGRGLSSLIPHKKDKEGGESEVNYYGGDAGDAGAAKQNIPSNIEKVSQGQAAAQEEIVQQAPVKEKTEKVSDIALKSIMEVPLDSISPNPHQPRDDFNEEGLQELANSIKEHGVLQPLVVSRKESGDYELIAGERRLEAAKIVGLEKVPVIVKKVNEQNKAELALIENIQRYDLNPIEEARAYKKLQDTFAMTQEEVALRAGKSRSAVSNALRLLNLPMEIQKALMTGIITEGHARSILSVSNAEKQRALFDLIVREGLTVRQVEDKVRDVAPGANKPKKRHADPNLIENERRLSEALGTKVHIRKSKTGGQIVIDYYSDEEFNSLLSNLLK